MNIHTGKPFEWEQANIYKISRSWLEAPVKKLDAQETVIDLKLGGTS